MTDTYHENIVKRLTTATSTSESEITPTATGNRHNGPERRLNPRKTITSQGPLHVALLESGEQRGTGRIRDVSAHGIFVETKAKFTSKETHVQVQFQLPGNDNDYRAWGQVAHKTEDGIGIAVDVLEPKTLASLQAVERHVG
jgi:hypothetical protein